MPGFPPLGPWLASVFVVPAWRGQGIGGLLLDGILSDARHLGMPRVYLFTTEARGYYLQRGWQVREPRAVLGIPGEILSYELDAE